MAGDEVINRHIRLFSLEEAEARIKSGEWQIHKFKHGFVITEIKQFPNERVLLIWVLSGKRFDEWKAEAFDHLKAFGKKHGCKTIEALCRLGLIKKLKPLGFTQTRAELRAAI